MHLKDILKKPDISTTIQANVKSLDIDALKSQHQHFAVISEVSKALILHMRLPDLLDHIMDLVCDNLKMDRGVLMLKEGQPEQFIPKVIIINNKNGLLVPLDNSTALADALVLLRDNRDLSRRMGQAGRWYVEQYFDRKIAEKELLDYYARINVKV